MNIYVDAWCSGNPGNGGWRGLYKDVDIFNRKPKSKITNNIGEYFAIIDAIKWIEKNKPSDKVIIWSDSKTAISWFRRMKVKTSLKDVVLNKVILKTERYLRQTNLNNIKVMKWDTKKRGEIPADFGRKKKKSNI